ncbi:hypothetical protein AVL50_19275 [Flammeovirga sp. SJP92]|nr:hypothetical protein AVL50_19275 [Flammeovirga sp. SJP92]
MACNFYKYSFYVFFILATRFREVWIPFAFNEEFIDLTILWGSTKTAHIEYSVLAPVEIISYWERRWFLVRKSGSLRLFLVIKIEIAFSIALK